MSLSPGTRLGAFEILGAIGAGGMAEVYQARDSRLDRIVALKVIAADTTRHPDLVARFEREARSASALNHPNIVTIYEIGTEGDTPYIAMEFIAGRTLRDEVRSGQLSLRQLLDIAVQVADGLAKAHDAGIVHRDLKPENVMINADGLVKILDFGLARALPFDRDSSPDAVTATGLLTREGVVLGTYVYMSPEQARGRQVGPASDQFSLGSMLYEMVTGTRPFERPSEVQTLSAIIEAEPAPIGTLTPKTPAQLQQVIHRCLSKEPSGRYASTTDLARDLAFARQHLTATTAALTPAASAAPPRRGARASAMVALVLAGVLAGVLGVGWFVSQSAASRTANAGTAVPFGERDWLLICEFQNQTGEEIFDKSLSTALAVSLGQSSYVNIVPSTRIQAVLRQMRRSPLAPLDVDTAREIAQREGIRLVMAPTIAGVGGVYMLSAALLDPSSGAAVATATARASDRREVIAALDELGRQARRTLGEAASAIAKQAAPLMTATTSSLEALKLLSQGVEMSRAQQFKEARTLYENALRVDPSFTAAKVALGMLEWEFFDPPNGKQLLAEAAQQTDHLTLVEKYTTVALDAQVRNDLTKAVDTWKAFLALYPDRASAHNNLGRVYHQLWRLDEAATEFREAIRLEPTLMLSYFSLNSIYLHDFGDFDAVIALCKQQIAQTDQNPWAYVYLGWASLGKGDLEPARVAFERTLELFKNLTWAAEGLGHTYRRLARYPEALQAFQRMLAANPGLTVATYHAGIVTGLMGDEPGARKLFAAYRADAEKRARQNEPGALFDLAVAHARLGDMAQARAIGERAAKLPRDEYSSARSWFLAFPTLARPAPTGVGPDSYFDLARLHAVAGKTAEAIDALATALQNGYRHHAWIRATPDFDSILADPRLQALLAKTFAR